MKIKVIGQKDASLEISPDVFGLKPNHKLISQVVLAHLANRRKPTAHTKTRGEVSGGGKKPWRQKGTGNARAGSSRSPLWRGGGVTFGPRKNRNYSKKIPSKISNSALKMVLSLKFKENKIIVTPILKVDKISTSQMQSFFEKLPIKEGKIILVLAKTDVKLELSVSNLGYLKTILPDGLNVIDILSSDYIVTDKAGLKAIEEKLKKGVKNDLK